MSKTSLKVSASWSKVFEHKGFKLSASSGNDTLVYLDAPEAYPKKDNDDKRQGCFSLQRDQLYALRDMLNLAIADLERANNWPKKPVMRGTKLDIEETDD